MKQNNRRAVAFVGVAAMVWIAGNACSSSKPTEEGASSNTENPQQQADAAAQTDSVPGGAPNATGGTDAAAAGAPQTDPAQGAPADAGSEKKASEQATAAKWSGKSIPQEVRQQPFQAEDGALLNAYYFVRSGDESWETVAQKIYGSDTQAKQLQAWNSASKLSPGNIVYYNSVTRPGDTAMMKVYAEDYGANLEEVKVGEGESLSKIAARLYGNIQSWKELAAINPDLKNPDMVRPGTVLKTQPSQIDIATAMAGTKQVASAQPQASTPQTQQAPQAPQSKDTTKPAATTQQGEQLAQAGLPQNAQTAPQQGQVANNGNPYNERARPKTDTRTPASRREEPAEEPGFIGGMMERMKGNPLMAGVFGLGILGGLGFAGMKLRTRFGNQG